MFHTVRPTIKFRLYCTDSIRPYSIWPYTVRFVRKYCILLRTLEMDTALPGKHTRILYNTLKRKEANVLVQLRTGMARLNGYLYQIGAVESDLCTCGQARETVKHFLFRCTRWEAYRTQMLAHTETRRGNLSFYLGGKALSDPDQWAPDMDAVRATIKFAMATGRLDTEMEPPIYN